MTFNIIFVIINHYKKGEIQLILNIKLTLVLRKERNNKNTNVNIIYRGSGNESKKFLYFNFCSMS